MNPTADSRIRETEWFINPLIPLMQYKVFSARVGNLLYYVTAERGITRNGINIGVAIDKPVAVQIDEHSDIQDNSADKFEQLRKFLSKPV